MLRLKHGCLALSSAAILWLLAGCDTAGVGMSSDGKSVAVSHNGSLWLADVENEKWREVPVSGAVFGAPSWSPTGKHVVFEVIGPSEEQRTDGQQKADDDNRSTVLYDVATGQITTLGKDLAGPFAWRTDGARFLAQAVDKQKAEIRWVETNGTVTGSVQLPALVGSLIVLPGETDFAFIGLKSDGNTLLSDIYLADGQDIERLTSTGDVVGLGLQERQGRLLWARSADNKAQVSLSLSSYDLSSRRIAAVPLPKRLSSVSPQNGYLPALQSVSFAPNGSRMALVVGYSKKLNDGSAHGYAACYSMEADGTGATLIRSTGVDAGGRLYPAWSHNGDRLAVLDNSGSEPKLFVYNADGTGKRMASLPKKPAATAN